MEPDRKYRMTRIAIAHDWLATPRGAERVLSEFCSIFQNVEVYTLFGNPDFLPGVVGQHSVYVSTMNRIPGVAQYYRYLLPLFRGAVAELKVDQADLLLSISHSVAKAIPHASDIPHICYCLTPTRYIWEPQLYGLSMPGSWKGKLAAWATQGLRRHDLQSNKQVDHFVAISKTVQERIRTHYQRDSEIIYPCVDLDFYRPQYRLRQDFYLIVSALVDQKRIGLAVEAFNQNGKKLRIVGSGPLERTLQSLSGENIEFLGWQSDDAIVEFYNSAQALIFPGSEDFGMVPVEAQACGCPVIAYQEGGVTETIVAGETGLFFPEATADSLNLAIQQFERSSFDAARAVVNSKRFSRSVFYQAWNAFLKRIGFNLPELNSF